MCISQCKETEDYYKQDIKKFFEFIKEANQNGIEYNGQIYLIEASFLADMSCHWNVTGLGGACKVSNYVSICAVVY